jgi:hypothetical protein
VHGVSAVTLDTPRTAVLSYKTDCGLQRVLDVPQRTR